MEVIVYQKRKFEQVQYSINDEILVYSAFYIINVFVWCHHRYILINKNYIDK